MKIKKIVGVILILSLVLITIFIRELFDLNPSKKVQILLLIIMYIVIFGMYFSDLYHVVTKQQFTTTKYIIVTNIVRITSVSILLFIAFNYEHPKNFEDMILFNRINMWIMLSLAVSGILSDYLKNDKFKKDL